MDYPCGGRRLSRRAWCRHNDALFHSRPAPPAPILRFDIVIVGAGLAGASLAVALRGSPLRLALVEAHPPAAGGDGRAYAVSPAGMAFLHEIGVWPHLDPARLTPVHDMHIRGDDGGALDFAASESGAAALAWIAESGPIQRELRETVRRQPNLALFCPARPQSLQLGAASARLALADGRVLEAGLIVGADGTDSWVREQAGLAAQTLAYGETGVVANFSCARPHGNAAWQWFRPDGVLAWLPLPENRVSMVWSTADAHARKLLALPADELCRRVAAAGDMQLGALAPLSAAAGFPLRFMRVPRIIAPRLALLGDAAHAIHPLSGHGINLGFQDARRLAGVLAAMAPHEDCGDERLLRRYERARAEETALLQWTTHGLQQLFQPTHGLIRLARNLGLNLTDRVPVLKNALARYAMGETPAN